MVDIRKEHSMQHFNEFDKKCTTPLTGVVILSNAMQLNVPKTILALRETRQ